MSTPVSSGAEAGPPADGAGPGDREEPVTSGAGRLERGAVAWLIGLLLAVLGPVSRLAWYLRVNAAQLADPGPVLAAMAASTLVCAVLTIVVTRASNRSPVVVGAALGAVGHLAFGAAIFGDDAVLRPFAWLVVAVIVAIGVGDLARRPVPLAVLVVLAVGMSAVGIAGYLAERPEATAARTRVEVSGRAERTPDVWFFLADGFGRSDQLSEVVGHDTAPFEGRLAERGFVVDPAATVNYGSTELSLPSMLEQETTVVSDADLGSSASKRAVVRSGNRTVDELQGLGYKYVHAGPGLIDWLRCDPEVADLCVDPGSGRRMRFGESARAVLDLTPLGPALRASAAHTDPVADPEQVVEEVLDRRSGFGAAPVFVYSHLMTPHPPYRFDERCRPLDPWVGGVAGGWPDAERESYAGATACLERQLVRAVDRIIAEDPDAIIVIAGDHGPAFGLTSKLLADTSEDEIAQRFAVLRTARLPDSCRSDDPRASSAVNTFRVVVACLQGKEPRLVEPRAFLTFSGTVEELPTPVIPPG